MLRKIIFTIILLLLVNLVNAQGRANIWLMGYGPTSNGSKLDFNQSPVQIDSNYAIMPFFETNVTISDESGNLLFASNGVFIMNANNDTMMNGDGLNPSWFTTLWQNYGLLIPQGNLVIPFPGDSNKYILFHVTVESQMGQGYDPMHLYYSIIDMQLDNGLGGVTQKNVPLISDTLEYGEITGVKHANGRDWWIIVHKLYSTIFFKVLVTNSGISVYTQDIGTYRNDASGQSVFSPDGNWFAHYNPGTDLDVFIFDRCTGLLSNFVNIPINDSAACWGLAFSSNSRYLYVASYKYVYQFDVMQTNIASTQTTVAVWDGFYSPNPPFATTFFLAQLAPDGKIYICTSNSSKHLHVIDMPDSAGIACNVIQHGAFLNGGNCLSTVANHPNYYLGPVSGSVCDSLTNIGMPQYGNFRFTVSPNPVNGGSMQIRYLLPQNAGGLFQLLDISGKEVFKYHLPPWSTYQNFTLPEISAGIYMAVITSKGIKNYRKVGVVR